MTTEYIENDTSIFLNESLTHQNESRLRSLLDESNKTLLEKESTIENENRSLKSTSTLNKLLESKIRMLESKIENSQGLDVNNCKSHLEEI